MLDRRNLDRAIDDAGAERGFAHSSRHVPARQRRLIQIGTTEHDAGIDRRGLQHHQHLLAGVQADAAGA